MEKPSHSSAGPLPLSPAAGGGDPQKDGNFEDLRDLPVNVVTEPSQLPLAFLNPSPEHEMTIGFDTEGVSYGSRDPRLCIIQLAFEDAIYIVDAVEGGDALVQACKLALECSYITKVVHDCKRDFEVLFLKHQIRLNNVWDTQLAYQLIEEQIDPCANSSRYISFVNLVADERYCGFLYKEKTDVREKFKSDKEYWQHRPLNEEMISTSKNDVRYLLHIRQRMLANMNPKSLSLISVRGKLHCHCYCTDSLPPLPTLTGLGAAAGEFANDEIIEIVNFPQEKMGSLYGINGAIFQDIRKQCQAYIFTCRYTLTNKVVIIGPRNHVLTAAAIVRGRIPR